ncbi:hypothetical protein HRM2_03700 [Desulforapulum autotrophicum HRM2]|uniref:Uncharacterized protein n=1 Tax=Desulforapulum autotrophicum (strain ATCC 43914 / DSM 3382 / VKM B-1955 / HRM2) TaxID=177437 RepID=C0QGL4_DESAH|nr:hypothetical protein HRM2_03700 [Desulforapulum autotrophicum HRM2]
MLFYLVTAEQFCVKGSFFSNDGRRFFCTDIRRNETTSREVLRCPSLFRIAPIL